jgi:hypothetical protein
VQDGKQTFVGEGRRLHHATSANANVAGFFAGLCVPRGPFIPASIPLRSKAEQMNAVTVADVKT